MIVVKLGGAVCQNPAALDDVAASWHRAGGRWVIVHGGGPQLDAALAPFGPPQRIAGLRVTPPETTAALRKGLDAVGERLTQDLQARGLPVMHVHSTWSLLAAEAVQDPAGLGRVGTPTGFSADVLERILPPDTIAVIGPLGWDAEGALNVNADDAAKQIAMSLQAERLVLTTDVAQVRDATGAAIERLDPTGAVHLIDSAVAQGGMVPKLRAAVHALGAGVTEVLVGDAVTAWDGTATVIRSTLPAGA